MRKRLYLIIGVFAILLLLFASFNSGIFGTKLIVYASPGDAYGNDIKFIEVWEGSVLKANFTTSGGSVRINASKTITFNVTVWFNSTLASSQSEAVSYTRVYLNITGVVTNAELTNVEVSGPVGGFYKLVERYVVAAGTLSEGQTYACSVLYQGYY
jgi:hypothetical protein